MIDFDAISTISDVDFQNPGQTWAHTCAADATLLLIAFNHNNGNPVAGAMNAVTYAGNACTLLTSIRILDAATNDQIHLEVWYTYAPASGVNNIVANSGGGVANGSAVAASYVGTRSEDVFGVTSSNSTAGGLSVSTSVTGYEDGIVVAAGGAEANNPIIVPVEQSDRGTAAYNLGGGFNCRSAVSDKQGSGTVTVSYTRGLVRALAIIAVPLRPAETGRVRGVSYTFDIWDPEQKILNEQGRNVPPWEIKRDRWIRVTGLLLPSSEAYDSFADDPEVAYIESVTYDDTAGSLTIKTSRGELGEVILARATGRKTL